MKYRPIGKKDYTDKREWRKNVGCRRNYYSIEYYSLKNRRMNGMEM